MDLGIKGAAISTVIAYVIFSIFLLFDVMRGLGGFKFFKELSRAARREKFLGISDAILYCQRASLTVNRLQ